LATLLEKSRSGLTPSPAVNHRPVNSFRKKNAPSKEEYRIGLPTVASSQKKPLLKQGLYTKG
jgi:hypothetical protein